jgi:hypothetical protein
MVLIAVHRAGSKVIGGMPGNGDSPGLDRVLVLAMTPFQRDRKPSVFFDNLDDFPDFQDESPGIY